MSHLGNNIARLRGFKRVTQKEISAKLNIRQQDYSKIEKSEEIDENMLLLISDALEMPVELIKQLDNNSVVSLNQTGGNTGSIFYQVNPIEKIQEIYERLLKSECEKNKLLEKMLEQAKSSK